MSAVSLVEHGQFTPNRSGVVEVWLSGAQAPLPAGELREASEGLCFRYFDDYLARSLAVPLGPYLPLKANRWFVPGVALDAPGPIRDAGPDSWGRAVIAQQAALIDEIEYGYSPAEIDYLGGPEQSRFGAISVRAQGIPQYQHFDRPPESISVEELMAAARLVEQSRPIPFGHGAIAQALAVFGGARPKALGRAGDREVLWKFRSLADATNVIGAEAACLWLARQVGLSVPTGRLVDSSAGSFLQIDRFDRRPDGSRQMVLSALSLLETVPSTQLRGYLAIRDVLRAWSDEADSVGPELFRRIAFNIAIGNTDDHLRNHAAYWDGRGLSLTPAFDLVPTASRVREQKLVLSYGTDIADRRANFAALIDLAGEYDLSRAEAIDTVGEMIESIREAWPDAMEHGRLDTRAREFYEPLILSTWALVDMPRR